MNKKCFTFKNFDLLLNIVSINQKKLALEILGEGGGRGGGVCSLHPLQMHLCVIMVKKFKQEWWHIITALYMQDKLCPNAS